MDPLVFNAFTGKWQNASNVNASGNSLGLQIGAFDGSAVSLLPAVGNTLQIDGGQTATIESALQMQSGAASEDIPAYSCSLVFNGGAANEQVGQMTVSGLASSSCQATIYTSQSADATINGAIRVGTLTPGTSYTYNFTTLHATWPNSSEHQYYGSMGIYATDHTGATGVAEGWRLIFNLGFQNGFSGASSSTEYNPAYRWMPLHNGALAFRGLIRTPSSGNVNNTTIAQLPSQYAPANYCRIPVSCTSTPGQSGGYLLLRQDCNLQFAGIPSLNSATFDITGIVHPGS